MQINNNYQPSFGKVIYHSELKQALETGVFSEKAKQAINKFKTDYDKSDVTVLLGLANARQCKTRLDAQVFYENPITKEIDPRTFGYRSENPVKKLFGIGPVGFLRKVAMNVQSIAETLCLK